MNKVDFKSMMSRFVVALFFFSSSSFGQSEIDLLVVYSPSAKALMADPNAQIVNFVEYANTALTNTGADYRYRLVHVQEHNWLSDDSLGSEELDNLRIDPTIQQLRDQYGADLVAGIVPQSNGLCGIGFVLNGDDSTQQFYSGVNAYGFSLTGHSCGGHSFAHELGHNMGLAHSYAQGSQGGLAYWARGHGLDDPDIDVNFITIMAYSSAYNVSNAAGFLQIHSNPELNSCLNFPCGKDRFEQDGADARRALDIAAPQVEGFLPVATVTASQPIIYEDAEDGTTNGWNIADNSPSGATIANVFDGAVQGRVIEFSGSGRQNSFQLGKDADGSVWGENNRKNIKWSMNYSERFLIYVQLQTTGGRRYIQYKEGVEPPLGRGRYVIIGLGSGIKDGTWRAFERNLDDDLHSIFPNEQILLVNGFIIRGSGKIDGIELF